MKILALDFDGVISDSAVESFVVALRTFARQSGEKGIAAAGRDLADADAATIRAHSLYRGFLDLMPLGNRAEDFAVALRLLEAGENVDQQDQFDRFRDELGEEFLGSFHRAFYLERATFRSSDPAGWLALLGPFHDFVEILRRRASDRVLALATAKDRVSIDLLLDAYGIADLFAPELIVDKEAGRSKRAHLALLRERLGVGFEEITFVDDKLNHLEDVSDLGVRCALSAWGYNGERERRLAAQRGFLVCELPDAEVDLFGTAQGG